MLREACRVGRRVLQLVLPVLLPSWRFFDSIGPSPRLECACLRPGEVAPVRWHRLAFTPSRLGPVALAFRLVFNAARNDTLFLIACCERVPEDGSKHAQDAIAKRLYAHAVASGWLTVEHDRMCYRIIEVGRDAAGELAEERVFVSLPIDVRTLALGGKS